MGAVIRPDARGRRKAGAQQPRRPVTLAWIDSREAVIVRWIDRAARWERIRSGVPAHHRATGHVRHDPDIRHGGGGAPQTAGEPRRLEHLDRFLESVAARLPAAEDLLLIGPGTVHEHLARRIREDDVEHRIRRDVRCQPAARLTRGQLVARLGEAIGKRPRRRALGGVS